MYNTAQGIAALGRNNDSMLVHMTPNEVQGLQKLAMASGGSLTINPHTGLPEAGFLDSVLPMLLGVGANFLFPGLGALGSAAISGGATALTSGSLTKGLLAGLGAYGLSGIGDALAGAGEQVANTASSTAATQAGQKAAETALANSALTPPAVAPVAPDVGSGAFGDVQAQAMRDMGAAPQNAVQTTAAARPADFVANPYSPEGMAYMQSQGVTPQTAAQSAGDFASNASPYKPNEAVLGSQRLGDMYTGAQQPDVLKKAVLSKNGLMALAGAVPIVSDMMTSKNTTGANQYVPTNVFKPVAPYRRELAPLKPGDSEQDYYTGRKIPGMGNSLANFGYAEGGGVYPNLNFAQPQQRMDPMQQNLNNYGEPVGYAEGGSAQAPAKGPMRFSMENSGFFDAPPARAAAPAAYVPFTLYGPEGFKPVASQRTPITQAEATAAAPPPPPEPAPKATPPWFTNDNYTGGYMAGGGSVGYAQGGISDIPNTYAAGGKLLRGPGDGVSDSIPAVITGPKPQRAALADGEFVVPARIVSELGNGSTEAGARKLYAMMDRVQHARKKSIGKNRVAVNSRAEKLLPA